MVTPICRYNIMTSLGTTVVTHNETSAALPDKEIRQESFSGIAKTKVNYDVCTQEWKLNIALGSSPI